MESGSPGEAPEAGALTVDAGLPLSGEDWPPGLLEKLKVVKQGDVIGSVPLLYLAAPQAPIWARSHDYIDVVDETVVPVISDVAEYPEYFMITSQTCDIVESAGGRPNHPWIQAVPIFDQASSLNSGEKKMLKKRGWRRWLWHVPALEGFWVADLRIEIPLEKGVIAALEVRDGHLNDEDRRALGHRLATKRSRPAFSDEFCATVQGPLAARLRDLKKGNESLYGEMDPAVGVYVRMDNHLRPTRAEVALICDMPVSAAVLAWWEEWWDEASQATPSIGVTLLPLQVYDTATLTVAEFQQFRELPMDRVSPD